MDRLTQHDFRSLALHKQPWCVSLYLPTERTGNGWLQVPIRIKNMAARAEEMLIEHGLHSTDARRMLEPLRALPEQSAFLKGISEGMAIFLDAAGMKVWRLPHTFEERLVVGKRFLIKPLLPLFVGDKPFFVLAFSGNAVRLLEGNRWGLTEVEVPGMPQNMVDALHYDEPQKVRQAHSAAWGGGVRTPMKTHGQGGAADVAKDEALEFCRIVDRSLAKRMEHETAPLVFAGVDYLFPIFKQTCSYAHLAPEPVAGNPEAWSEEQLHTLAREIVAPLFKKELHEAIARSHRLAGSDYELLQLETVLRACEIGQVDTLLIDPQATEWGVFDAESSTLHLDPEHRAGNEDLLNLAIALTISNSGTVYPVESDELPNQSHVAALLRYPQVPMPVARTVSAT